MPWARFADDYLGNPKLASLSTAAIALDMASIIYSARDLRDGHLTDHDVRVIAALLHLRRWEPATDELVVVHRWIVIPGGWEIHDYLDYQPSRAQVLGERAAKHDAKVRAGRTGGLAKAKQTASSDPSKPLANAKQNPSPVPGPGPELPEYAAAAAGSGPGLAPARARGDGGLQPLGAVLNGSQQRRRRQLENSSEDEVPDEVRARLNQPPIGDQT